MIVVVLDSYQVAARQADSDEDDDSDGSSSDEEAEEGGKITKNKDEYGNDDVG